MRPINPETGKPYPRTRPIDWKRTRETLAWRQADKRFIDAGYIPLNEFAAFPWSKTLERVVATAHHPSGQRVYVKIERDS